MPQVIFDASLLKTQPARGMSVQATSQFSQQQFARKTAELEQSYKDRDKFAEMLKLDPVYASSQAAQEYIAGVLDGYIDRMTLINKNRTGPMTTQDLSEMQNERGRAMAEMNYIKGTSDEYVEAARRYNASPYEYDKETFDAWSEEWLTKGTKPEFNPLAPAVENPFLSGVRSLEEAGYESVDTNSYIGNKDGVEKWEKTSVYNLKGDEPEVVSERIGSNPEMQYNIQKTFGSTRVDDATKEFYLEQANGNEVLAANMWYNEGMSSILRSGHSTPYNRRPPIRSSSMYGGANLRFDGGGLWEGKYKILGIESNVPVANETLDNAVVFTRPQSKKNPVSVPTRLLDLPGGVEAKGASVDAVVHVADNDKTYFIIDKNSLDKVSFTKKAMEAYPKGVFETDPDKKDYFKIKEGAEDDVVISAPTGNVRSLVDSWTGGFFSEALKTLPKKATKSGKGVTLEFEGNTYTESELRDAGWEDKDIAKLKQRQ